eukprot:7452874-Alexandrium_andersonii.AAC.1
MPTTSAIRQDSVQLRQAVRPRHRRKNNTPINACARAECPETPNGVSRGIAASVAGTDQSGQSL